MARGYISLSTESIIKQYTEDLIFSNERKFPAQNTFTLLNQLFKLDSSIVYFMFI